MVHAPEVTDYVKRAATKMDAVSDDIDNVNVIKGKKPSPSYDDSSEFDAGKEKGNFRRYEEACDRVKNFYAVSGLPLFSSIPCWLLSRFCKWV